LLSPDSCAIDDGIKGGTVMDARRSAGKVSPKARSAARTSKPRKSASPAKPASPAKAQRKSASPAKAPRKAAAQADTGGWREETLARMRALILAADPEMAEERKWIKPTKPLGMPVWSHAGMVCTGEIYTNVVKLTFARGASLPDPKRLFNASLEGGTRRAIDIHEGEKLDVGAFKALVKAAVAENERSAKKR
jgi:hypothetical protein